MAGEPTTYSFLDLSGAIVHPFYGTFQFVGEGMGSVSVKMQETKTVHDIAADGSVMISKIAGNNGSLDLKVQQTSALHKFLLGLYNYLLIADTIQWAQITILLRNTSDGSSHVATGVSFSKKADKDYTKQGGQVDWSLMAADIQSLNA